MSKRLGISILALIISLPVFAQGTENVIRWGEYIGTFAPILICSVIGLILQIITFALENKFSAIASAIVAFAIVGMTIFLTVKFSLSLIMVFISLLSLALFYKSYKILQSKNV